MLRTRIYTAIVFVPVLFGLVYTGGLPLAVACFAISGLMLWEYFRFANVGDFMARLGVGAGLWVAALTLSWLTSAELSLPCLIIAILFFWLLQAQPVESALHRAAHVAFGVVYCGMLLPYLALLRSLSQDVAILALLCVWLADSGAYFVGRRYGHHKLYSKVSPGKTVEGAVGGLMCSVGVAFMARWLLQMQLKVIDTVALALIAATLGVVGDLSESLIKRSVGVKDSSQLIPGHGGFLDRFDALLFVAPAFYVYAKIVGL